MREINVQNTASLISFDEFNAATHHVFTFSLLTFDSISFSNGGAFFELSHQSTPLSQVVVANCFFLSNRGGHISIENSDTSPDRLKVVVVTDSFFIGNQHEARAIVNVEGNVHLVM